MLNKELSHFSESSKSGNQISEYICTTFLDKQQELDLPSLRIDEINDSGGLVGKIESQHNRNLNQVSNTKAMMSSISGIKPSNSISEDTILPKFGCSVDKEDELEEVRTNLSCTISTFFSCMNN